MSRPECAELKEQPMTSGASKAFKLHADEPERSAGGLAVTGAAGGGQFRALTVAEPCDS
jgi:hypothetical protein